MHFVDRRHNRTHHDYTQHGHPERAFAAANASRRTLRLTSGKSPHHERRQHRVLKEVRALPDRKVRFVNRIRRPGREEPVKETFEDAARVRRREDIRRCQQDERCPDCSRDPLFDLGSCHSERSAPGARSRRIPFAAKISFSFPSARCRLSPPSASPSAAAHAGDASHLWGSPRPGAARVRWCGPRCQ